MPKKATFPETLNDLPKSSKYRIHHWADYVELLCLVDPDGYVSQADVLDRVPERIKDLGEGPKEMLEDEASDYSAGERDDVWEGRVKEWFRHLLYRSKVFRTRYPFSVGTDATDVKLNNTPTLMQKMYISLLLSANLGYVPNSEKALTNSFEVLSLEVLKMCLPAYAEVHIFGTNSLKKGKYKEGNLWKRIVALAKDLNERVKPVGEEFSPHDVGDGGLDIVGWVPLGDNTPGSILIFGQCACTTKWVTKQHDSSYQAWSNRIDFTVPPSNTVFIPYFFRNLDGSWHKKTEIKHSILIDRQRLMHFLVQKEAVFEALPSFEVVETILECKEKTV